LIGSPSRSANHGDRSESLHEFRLLSRCRPDQPQVIETAPHIHRSHLRLSNSTLRSQRNRLRLRNLARLSWPPFQQQPIYLPSCCEIVNNVLASFSQRAANAVAPASRKLGRRYHSFQPS